MLVLGCIDQHFQLLANHAKTKKTHVDDQSPKSPIIRAKLLKFSQFRKLSTYEWSFPKTGNQIIRTIKIGVFVEKLSSRVVPDRGKPITKTFTTFSCSSISNSFSKDWRQPEIL